jgi:hypothetical protein
MDYFINGSNTNYKNSLGVFNSTTSNDFGGDSATPIIGQRGCPTTSNGHEDGFTIQ